MKSFKDTCIWYGEMIKDIFKKPWWCGYEKARDCANCGNHRFEKIVQQQTEAGEIND